MKKLFLIICLTSVLFAINNETIKKSTLQDGNQTAITISKDSVDEVLKKYDKTLILLENTEQSINNYHETLQSSIISIKETYSEVSPNISKNTERIISAVEDVNATVKSSMDNIEQKINDYYVIEIVALISFLISVNNILEIILKLKRFRFIRNWLRKIRTVDTSVS